LIVGGLYSVTALRKLTMRVTVYTKHQLVLIRHGEEGAESLHA